jgi:tetratricopeptide (TPR) repeat protein
MTMFQKPNVGIAFTPQEQAEEPVFDAPRDAWAVTPARRWALAYLLVQLCVVTFIYPTFNGTFLPGDESTASISSSFGKLPSIRQSGGPVRFWDGMMYDVYGLKTIWAGPQKLPQFSPASYTLILVERQFFGSRPRGYHVISILLHACNALLLWGLLRRLELPGAWLAAALFAVDPVQVDTVSWIAQQRYLVCGLFYFGALMVYLRRAGLNPVPPSPLPGTEPLIRLALPENATALYILSMVLFLLALLSHVVGATFPLVVLVLIWWERGRLDRRDIVPLIPFAALSVLFALTTAFLAVSRSGRLWLAYPGGLNWVVIWGHGVWTYLLAVVLPINLSFVYPTWTADSVRLWQWIYPLSAIFVLVALWILRRRWGRGPFTAAMLFICLLLPSALGASDATDGDVPGVMVREHVVYLACAAVLVPLAVLLAEAISNPRLTGRLATMPGLLAAVALVILLPLSIASAQHTVAYDSETSVWRNVLRSQSNSSMALNTLGQLELADKKYDDAQQHFLAALKTDPDDSQARMNLARVAEQQQQYDVAIDRYDEVLARHPDNAGAHFGLGEVLAAQGDTSDAMSEYAKVRKLDPGNALVCNNIGLIDAQLGELDEAVKQYQTAIKLDSRSLPAYLNLANAQFQLRKYLDAKETLEKALQVDPTSYVAWLNAGVMAEAVGDTQDAEKYFRHAIYCKYDSADAFNDLGMVLMKQGDPPGKIDHLGEAIYCFKRATELDPASTSAAQNLAIAQQRKDAIIAQQQLHY